jgi:hypothetical protein
MDSQALLESRVQSQVRLDTLLVGAHLHSYSCTKENSSNSRDFPIPILSQLQTWIEREYQFPRVRSGRIVRLLSQRMRVRGFDEGGLKSQYIVARAHTYPFPNPCLAFVVETVSESSSRKVPNLFLD